MSYFYTQSHVEIQPYRGLGQKHVQPDGGARNTRDEDIEREIGKLARNPGKFAELQSAEKSKAHPVGIRVLPAPGYTGDNIIREPEKPRPMLRVIPDRTDAELRALLPQGVPPKVQAQDQMIASPGYIQKMTGHSTSPLTQPLPPHPQSKKPLQLPQKSAGEMEPPGLKGVGKFSEVPIVHGRRAPTSKDFEMPPFQPKRRTHGVKSHGLAPPDTFILG
jgi:hypothetical protein